MRIVESLHMTTQVEDWSRVRSPSRARRRRRQGHPQNVVVREVPRKDAISIDGGRTYIMHPETAKTFWAMVLAGKDKERSEPLKYHAPSMFGLGILQRSPLFSMDLTS